jgi:uncharacterized membrane protein YdjX (TVP38/TMEM64 family)
VLLNYGFALTRVRFRGYLLWTWVCSLPGLFIYAAGADAAATAARDGRAPWGLILAAAGVLALLAAVVWRLRRRVRDDGEGAGRSPGVVTDRGPGSGVPPRPRTTGRS